MELKHASKEIFYRYMPCKRCNGLSRHAVRYKNSYFNTASEENEVCYVIWCMNCRHVYKREYIEITKSAKYCEWNLFVEKGVVPQ